MGAGGPFAAGAVESREARRVRGCVQRMEEAFAELGRQPRLDHEVAVLVVARVNVAPVVVPVRFRALLCRICATKPAHGLLHVRSRAVQRDLQE